MKELLAWLDGKKTYLCALVCAAAVIAHSQNWINLTALEIILGAFGGGGLAALRSGVNNNKK